MRAPSTWVDGQCMEHNQSPRLRHTAVILIALVLAGCHTGASPPPRAPAASPTADNIGADMSAADIAARAATALAGRPYLHVTGFISEDGHRVDFDIRRPDATTATCRLTGEGETVDIIRVGAFDYARASHRYWTTFRGGPLDVEPGMYVRASRAGRGLATLTKCLDIPAVVVQELTEADGLTKGARQLVDGVPAVVLVSTDLGTIYVSTRGAPDVLRVVSRNGPSAGVWDFTSYPVSPRILAPAAGQFVDLASLTPSGG
jgi:hypothetical protein